MTPDEQARRDVFFAAVSAIFSIDHVLPLAGRWERLVLRLAQRVLDRVGGRASKNG